MKRLLRAVRIVARDGGLPRWLRGLAALGLAPIPGPVDEVLGEIGRRDVWTKHVGPAIEPKLLPQVYRGIDATFQKVFHTSSAALIAFAAALTIWEISGAARGCMGALSRIYDTDDTRPW